MPDARRSNFDKLCDLVRAEYQEMPGLCLTPSQMRRLWNLDASTCDLLVAQLVTEGFLRQIEHEYVLGPAAWMSVVAAADAGTR